MVIKTTASVKYLTYAVKFRVILYVRGPLKKRCVRESDRRERLQFKSLNNRSGKTINSGTTDGSFTVFVHKLHMDVKMYECRS
jgi:hypothetical protein